MRKKILLSAKTQHDVMKDVIKILKENEEFEFIFHDPIRYCLDLEDLPNFFKNIEFLIVKVGSECSIDLLHYAKLYNIPTLHDIDTVLICKNKVALDHVLRKVLNEHSNELKNFLLPKSWTCSLTNIKVFKEWASSRLPLVIKSHYQHDKYMRFNFLVREVEKDINYFCERYKNFLSYDVYIQKFIECDGIDRKIYVVGDKIFGIKRENPIYIFLRKNPNDIDVDTIEREEFEISKEIRNLANILGEKLKLKIFGFDLVKPLNQNEFYLIDLNDFPGLRGIKNIDKILADFLKEIISS